MAYASVVVRPVPVRLSNRGESCYGFLGASAGLSTDGGGVDGDGRVLTGSK